MAKHIYSTEDSIQLHPVIFEGESQPNKAGDGTDSSDTPTSKENQASTGWGAGQQKSCTDLDFTFVYSLLSSPTGSAETNSFATSQYGRPATIFSCNQPTTSICHHTTIVIGCDGLLPVISTTTGLSPPSSSMPLLSSVSSATTASPLSSSTTSPTPASPSTMSLSLSPEAMVRPLIQP